MAADAVAQATSRTTTRVMSCAARIVVTGQTAILDGLAEHGIARLHQLERRWSRFLPTSEISGLNEADGEPRTATPDTVRLVEALIRAWHATDGAFDPTLLGSLVELGYAAGRNDATHRTSLPAGIAPQGRPDGVLVDPDSGWIQLPPGTTLDPGGLGKGLAADIVVEELIRRGASGALVEIGGDMCVSGTPPESDAWTIAIAPAFEDGPRRSIQLREGGVATSTSRLRTWTHDGAVRHHLIDPRTLHSSESDAVSCTVIAGSAAWAEAFAKLPFTHTPQSSIERFDARGLAASIVMADGRLRDSAAWEGFAR